MRYPIYPDQNINRSSWMCADSKNLNILSIRAATMPAMTPINMDIKPILKKLPHTFNGTVGENVSSVAVYS